MPGHAQASGEPLGHRANLLEEACSQGPGVANAPQLEVVRVLALEVRVNPNTVSRAWRELARDGVVETRRGEGGYVAQGGLELCRALRDERISERLGRAVAEARSAGLEEDEVRELVHDALEAWQQVCPERTTPDKQASVSVTEEEEEVSK